VVGIVGWLGASVRRLGPDDRLCVVEAPLLGLAPRTTTPGWHFLPRGLLHFACYPSEPQRLRVDLTGAQAAVSREGSTLDLEAVVTYTIAPAGVLDLHRAHGPGYEAGWLEGLVRRATAERVAAVSYEVVRNRDPELPQAVRAIVARESGTAGLAIAGLRIGQVAGVGERGGDIRRAPVDPLPRTVVVIGVDAFTWRIADPLMTAGRMPHLRRLVERGARANLRTISPILSPVIWTSVATGMKPARHGIVDFVVNARDTGALVPVTSAMRRVPALWNLMSRQEVDVDVVAWWATWPAEPVRGRIVTDRVAFQLFDAPTADWTSADPEKSRGKTFPPELFGALLPLIRPPAAIEDEALAPFLGGGRLPAAGLDEPRRDLVRQFRTVLAAGQTYHSISRRLLRERPAAGSVAANAGAAAAAATAGGGSAPRLALLYYEGPDTTSHLFMRYRPPLLPGVEPADAALFGAMVDRYYELQDRYIGEIVEDAGPGAVIVVLSDHGFKSDDNRPLDSDSRVDRGRAAEWHTPVGLLAIAGPGIRAGIDVGAASVLDITPTVLALFGLPAARDMDGQPLAEALEPEFLAAHPVAWIDTYGGQRAPEDDVLAAGEGDREVIEKLRSIGYIGEERLTAQNNRGLIAMEEGDLDGAIAQFEDALAKGAHGPDVRVNLARAWLSKGDAEKARAAATEVLREDPRSKQAHVLLAGAALTEGDLAAAETELRAALAIDPSYTLAHARLGDVLQRRGRDDEALRSFERAVALAPLSPAEFNAIGNLHRRHHRLDRAIEAYRDALRADPQYIGAYNNLGLCLQEQGRLDEAGALYDRALAIRPENPILRNSRATLLAARGDRGGALAEVDRALAANPDWEVGLGNRATLLFELGRIPEAKEAFVRWLAIEPDAIEGRLGHALTLLATGDPKGAEAEFAEVLKRDPANLRARVALGETLLRGGDLEQAQQHLEAAVAGGGRVTRAWNSLGEVYLRRGQRAEAARAFRRSLGIDPDQPAIRRRLAEAGG
jgi:tetratricopeptide (TPR) repeat protein